VAAYNDDPTLAYANLARTIQQSSKDYGDLALGVSKFLSDKRLLDEQVKTAAVAARDAEAQEAWLNKPANLVSMAQSLGFKGSAEELMNVAERDMPSVMGTFGLKIDPAQRAFVDAEGNVVTNRWVKQNGQALLGSLMVNSDPGSRIQQVISKNKFLLQENPNDPVAKKNLAEAEAAYQGYLKNPQPFLERHLAELAQARGFIASAGGNTGLADEKIKAVEGELGKITGQTRERANWVKLSSLAKQITGIDMDNVPPAVADNIATAVAHYKSTMNQIAENTKAGNFKSLLEGPTNAYKLAVEMDKNMQDTVGNRYVVDPNTGQRRAMTQGERQVDINNMAKNIWGHTLQQLEAAGITKAALGNRYPAEGMAPPAGVGGLKTDASELDNKVAWIRQHGQGMPKDVQARLNTILKEAQAAATGPNGSLFNASRALDKAVEEIKKYQSNPQKQTKVNSSIVQNVKQIPPPSSVLVSGAAKGYGLDLDEMAAAAQAYKFK
jgi:hypothetical protein